MPRAVSSLPTSLWVRSLLVVFQLLLILPGEGWLVMTLGSMSGEMGREWELGRAWGGEGRDCGGSTGGGEALMYGSGIVGSQSSLPCDVIV